MNDTLSRRFGQVAKKFGRGLTAAVKGSFLGVSVGLISKLLNPIEDLENKIKSLLGQADDMGEQAERFGTSEGELRRLQDLGQSVGLSPDKLNTMLQSFQKSIETAREETKKGVPLSDASKAVSQFMNEKDIAKSFFSFVQGLKQVGDVSGADQRKRIEKEVFGETQVGAGRKFIETDFGQQLNKLKLPNTSKLNAAYDNLQKLSAQQKVSEVQRNAQDFIQASSQIKPSTIAQMEEAEKIRQQRENAQLQSYDDLKKTSQNLEEVKGLLQDTTNKIIFGLGELTGLIKEMTQAIKGSRIFKGLFGS